MDIKLISCKYLTLLSSFSLSLGCLAAVRDLFVSCGDPSTSLMERESNAALLLCYVALAFFRCRPSFHVHPSIMHIHGMAPAPMARMPVGKRIAGCNREARLLEACRHAASLWPSPPPARPVADRPGCTGSRHAARIAAPELGLGAADNQVEQEVRPRRGSRGQRKTRLPPKPRQA